MSLNLDLLLKPKSTALESERLRLCLPTTQDWTQWYYLREKSRSFLEPWEPLWPTGRLTKSYYHRRINNYYKKQRAGLGVYYHIFLKESDELIGGINILHIARGAMQNASLGYWVGQEFHSNGFMTEAVQTILPFAYETLGLHRIQVAIIPHNIASHRVVQKCRFFEERIARNYIKIHGQWEDHMIYSMTKEEWLAGSGVAVAAGKLVQIDT